MTNKQEMRDIFRPALLFCKHLSNLLPHLQFSLFSDINFKQFLKEMLSVIWLRHG